jgi:hypothetical protein
MLFKPCPPARLLDIGVECSWDDVACVDPCMSLVFLFPAPCPCSVSRKLNEKYGSYTHDPSIKPSIWSRLGF